jgi:hypothetical protein
MGCLGDIHVCMQENYFLSMCTSAMFLDNPRTCRTNLFKGQCPPKKQKKMKKGIMEMKEGLVCTYFVQEEVHFVH